jgi:hypothetical protein
MRNCRAAILPYGENAIQVDLWRSDFESPQSFGQDRCAISGGAPPAADRNLQKSDNMIACTRVQLTMAKREL